MDQRDAPLRKGVVELAVMASIARGETYGYAIVEALQEIPGLGFTESTVYPVLTRLCRDGCLVTRMADSPAGPRRRYYRLTVEGKARLHRLIENWKMVAQSLGNLLEGA
jgi:PadR family transcriptional regulator PadR